MNKQTRMIFYLLINILVSAVTTLTVLWLWERAHPRPEITIPVTENMDQSDLVNANEPDIELPIDISKDNVNVTIRAVVGAGNLEMEYVEIFNEGEHSADLTGWQLVNESSQSFIFPTMILNSNGAIKIHTRKGVNSVIELYWQSEAPKWQPGEIVELLEPDGEIIATYSIP